MNFLIQIKENLANTFVSIIFIFSTLFTFALGELFFYTPNGVDHIYHSTNRWLCCNVDTEGSFHEEPA